ncbi:hypothetical protein BZG36_02490 [Bifiguratus adelaidae]|uniref:Uncharacterized protein n=1 Tax=Bifiguratus adelaidae TaxID=1938954 RepID=A0A261Y187_9FUNG|nr:hypothetical protein BZG36_02490 [Bifiguratus adelaidae]
MKALVSPTSALTCTFTSAAGVIFLLILGGLFNADVEGLTESKGDPDPNVAASTCFLAAAIYAGFFVFCGCQSWIHSRNARQDIQL